KPLIQSSPTRHSSDLALHSYHDANGRFPPAYVGNAQANGSAFGVAYGDDNRNGPTGFAWGVFLLPYLEQAGLYRSFDLSLPCWAERKSRRLHSSDEWF